MEAINPTKSEKRLYRSYTDFLKKEIIISNVIKLRKKYGIPQSEGFPMREDREYHMPPSNWFSESKYRVVKKFAEKFLEDEGILVPSLYYLFLGYVFYNYIPEEVVFLNTTGNPLCLFDDAVTDERFFWPEKEMTDKFYPIVLRINPSASLGEIKDYLKTNKKVFALYKKTYSTSIISTTRKRSKEKRDEKIWVLHESGLSSSKIHSKLAREYPEIDTGIITKIISVQKKKRI